MAMGNDDLLAVYENLQDRLEDKVQLLSRVNAALQESQQKVRTLEAELREARTERDALKSRIVLVPPSDPGVPF